MGLVIVFFNVVFLGVGMHSIFTLMKRIELRQKEQNEYLYSFGRLIKPDLPKPEIIEKKVEMKKTKKKGFAYSPSRDSEVVLKGDLEDPFD